jgi:hypothetical protein
MAITNQLAEELSPKQLPKHGPAWTFYAFTAFAVLVVIAMALGLRIAAEAHWF